MTPDQNKFLNKTFIILGSIFTILPGIYLVVEGFKLAFRTRLLNLSDFLKNLLELYGIFPASLALLSGIFFIWLALFRRAGSNENNKQ